MLIYRFISFYLYILVSAIVVVINAVKTKDVLGEIDKTVKEIEKPMLTALTLDNGQLT